MSGSATLVLDVTRASRPRRGLGTDPAVWVPLLYGASLVLQRLAIPGTPVAVVLPMVLIVVVWGVRRGVFELSVRRTTWWLVAFAAAGAVLLLQVAFGSGRFLSVSSWLLFAVSWIPFAFQLRDRTKETFARTADRLVAIGVGLAVLSIVFVGVQTIGLPYVDLVARFVPANSLLQGYVTTYSVSFGSPIMRSNAWICLEASYVSFHLGALTIIAILRRRRRLVLAVLITGMLTTASGSGMVLLVIALAVLFARRRWDLLRPLVAPGLAAVVVLAVTPFGQGLLGRTGELSSNNSSSSLRAVRAYLELYPQWSGSAPAQWLGSGAGATQDAVGSYGVLGLVAPTGARLFYDYGLVVGAMLLVLFVVALRNSWAPEVALGAGLSFFTLQPGTSNVSLLLVAWMLVTWWSPCRNLLATPPAPVRTGAHRAAPRRRSDADRPDADPPDADPPTVVVPVARVASP